MNKLREYYDEMVSQKNPEDILDYVKSASVEQESKKISGTRWISTGIAAAAMVAVLSIGVGATGLVDFNQFLGKQLETSDEMLGNELLGMATDLKVIMPNKDYQVVMNAVTGDVNSVVFSFDIVRKDGKPVVEDFKSEPKEDKLFCFSDCIANIGGRKSGYNINMDQRYMQVNEEGNISVYVKGVHGSSFFDGFAGTKLIFVGKSFFDYEDYQEYYETDDAPTSGRYGIEAEVGEPLLELEEWTVEFVYTPSEKAEQRILCEELELEIPFFYEYTRKEDDDSTIKILQIELTHIGGMLTVEHDVKKHGENVFSGFLGNEVENGNKIKLIMKDGSEVPVYASKRATISFPNGSTTMKTNLSLEYRTPDFDDVPEIVDLEEVKAISINGFEYEF